MNVTVQHGIQVVHAGQHYFGGDQVDVPESVAAEWIRYRWAVEDQDDVQSRRAKVAKLRQEGLSVREVAERLGVSRSAVERDIRALAD